MPELALVVPTLNEVGNIKPLLQRLEIALKGISWEIIFVDDDSSDGTEDIIREFSAHNPRVRMIARIGRRGLSSACIEGMLATTAPYIAVMDADLQHDESLLPKMLSIIKNRGKDIVIASRFLKGGKSDVLSASRERLSRIGNFLSRMIIKVHLSDPLSGYFMLRRELLHETAHSLSGKGFKILVDILSSAKGTLKIEEIPLKFRDRLSGESKLDTLISVEFIKLLADKKFGKLIPVRFVIFVLVGLSGVVVHGLLLALFFKLYGQSFYVSQATATLIAMTTNFYFNNIFTYRDRRLRGYYFFRGLLSFYLICSIGAFVNFQVAESLYNVSVHWLLSGILGSVVGSVWNYGVTSSFTWKTAS